ncbi:transposase family protein (plasmid) [Pseudonocardia bannensis]|uniref:transposase family protein n=1 Tax=Pseudonocardia bannensis TaxID=630973 RepID=UPI001B7CDED8|nr:transposase family protein [Pseudonocardia bannensis]
MELPDPVALAAGLREVLAQVVDPRKRRGVRHGLVVVLTATVCAVVAGARSFVAVAEWVADLPVEVAAVLGTARRCPSEATIRRLLGKVDADRFDAVLGAFVQDLCTDVAPPVGAGCWQWTVRPCAAPATPAAPPPARSARGRVGICSR